MAGMRIEALSPVLGARVTDVDLARLDGPAFGAIEQALHRHLVLVIPGQELTPDQFVAFARRFGRPEPHVIDQFHHPADPNILILSNRRDASGRPLGLADGGTYFHCDYSYLDVPARCTTLYAQEIPGNDAGTTFANQRKAYEDLPAARRDAIDRLVVRHHYGNRNDLDEASRTAASPLSGEQKARMNWVRHPLVRKHPHGPWRSLYAVSGSSFSVEGMGDREGVALLDELKAHATSPAYCFTPTYAAKDVVIWDNCSLLHSAPLIDQARSRTLWRITVKEAGPTV